MANPDWDQFVADQPARAEALRPFLRHSLAAGALAAAPKELIAVALLAAQGYAAGVRSHAARALEQGATPDELREALAVLIPFVGIGRFLEAYPSVEGVIAGAGVAAMEGSAPAVDSVAEGATRPSTTL